MAAARTSTAALPKRAFTFADVFSVRPESAAKLRPTRALAKDEQWKRVHQLRLQKQRPLLGSPLPMDKPKATNRVDSSSVAAAAEADVAEPEFMEYADFMKHSNAEATFTDESMVARDEHLHSWFHQFPAHYGGMVSVLKKRWSLRSIEAESRETGQLCALNTFLEKTRSMNDSSLTLAWYVAPVFATAAFTGSAMPTMFAATAYLFGFPYFAAYFHVWPGVFPSYCKAVWRSQYHFEWKTTAVDARLRLSKVLAEELLKEAGTTKETQTDADMPFISAATSPLSKFASLPPGTIPPAQQDVLWSAQSKPLLSSSTSTKPQPVAKSRHALAQLYREIMTTATSPERSPNDIARGVVNLYNLLADEQTAGSETFLDDFLARMSSAHGARRAGKLLRSTIGSAPFFGRSGAYRLLSEWMNGDMHVDFQLAHDVELDLSDIEDLLYEKGIVMVWISHVV